MLNNWLKQLVLYLMRILLNTRLFMIHTSVYHVLDLYIIIIKTNIGG